VKIDTRRQVKKHPKTPKACNKARERKANNANAEKEAKSTYQTIKAR
jgi:hypothetical protein